MATAQNNGGRGMTIRSLYSLCHWGQSLFPQVIRTIVFMLLVVIPTEPVVQRREGFANDLESAVKHQAKRLVEVTEKFVD